jgi:hypothetical protein
MSGQSVWLNIVAACCVCVCVCSCFEQRAQLYTLGPHGLREVIGNMQTMEQRQNL